MLSDTFTVTKTRPVSCLYRLTWTIGMYQCNGKTLREACMFTRPIGGSEYDVYEKLFARAVHTAIVKSDTLILNYTWDYTWS